MLKPFCDVCKKAIEDDDFYGVAAPINGTGVNLEIKIISRPEDFHVHQRCVFASIRAAERRLNERPVEEGR